MAKITRSDAAPTDLGPISIGNVSFELPRKNSVYETDDALIVSSARTNPFLNVEEDVPVTDDTPAPAPDALDPHVNPTADHLSAFASQATKDAAATNETAIREAVGNASATRNDAAGEPTIAESLQATLATIGVDAAPAVPEDASETVAEPVKTTDTTAEEKS